MTEGAAAGEPVAAVAGASSDDDAVDAALSSIGRLVRPDLDVLTAAMTDLFVEMIPEFRHDEAIHQLMVSSTAANVAAFVDLLDHGISVEDIAVPAAAAEYARRFAQLDLSLEALLRAYRLGENAFLRWAVPILGGLGLDTGAALAATSELSRRANRYIDQVIEGLIDIYEDERRQWNSRSDAMRAATIRTVLVSDEIDVSTAEATVGASLRGWHRAAVLWSRSGTARILEVQRELGSITGLMPLVVLAEPGCLWAWWSATSSPRVEPASFEHLRDHYPDLRVTLGTPASGLAGFRSSHEEAQRARAVVASTDVTGGGPTDTAVEYDDVAVVGMLAARPEPLRAWVARTLGALARDDAPTERLRRTLRAYLAAERSSTEAAARLHLHKNTVHYRVRRAEELLGRSVGQARLDIEVALLACHHLGPAVLVP